MFGLWFYTETIRLIALDFHEVIVDLGETNSKYYHLLNSRFELFK